MTRAEIDALSNEELAALFAKSIDLGMRIILNDTMNNACVKYRKHVVGQAKKRILEYLEGGAANERGND